MNVIDVLKDKVDLMLNGCEQAANEKLIELVTFFYKVDKRISLEEQNYIDEFLEAVTWNSPVSIKTFHSSCISKVNEVIASSEDQISNYLSNLMQEISVLEALDKAKELAKEISDSDGEIADDEVKYLDLVMSY